MHQLHQHYVSVLSAYGWLTIHGIVDDKLPKNVGTASMVHEIESDRHPSRIAWQTALTNLQPDADAELPE